MSKNEKSRQIVSTSGLQIPLPLLAKYGLQPNAEVTLELTKDEIRIKPRYPTKTDIEDRALGLLFKYLGDAVYIKVAKIDQGINPNGGEKYIWRVEIYGRGFEEVLGVLDFSQMGELLSDIHLILNEIRQKAANHVTHR